MEKSAITDEPILKINDRIWYPVWTLARNEIKMKNYFASRSIPHYLPLRRVLKKNSVVNAYGKRYDYTKPLYIPMFPGYIFAALETEEKKALGYERSVIQVLDRQPDLEALLIDELNLIKQIEREAESHELVIKPEIQEGTLCLLHGKFEGWRGIVKKRKNKFEVIIALLEVNFTATIVYDIMETEPIQHINCMPIAMGLRQCPPFAAVFRHIQYRIHQLEIAHAYITALPRQMFCYLFVLFFIQFHVR